MSLHLFFLILQHCTSFLEFIHFPWADNILTRWCALWHTFFTCLYIKEKHYKISLQWLSQQLDILIYNSHSGIERHLPGVHYEEEGLFEISKNIDPLKNYPLNSRVAAYYGYHHKLKDINILPNSTANWTAITQCP